MFVGDEPFPLVVAFVFDFSGLLNFFLVARNLFCQFFSMF